VVEKQRGTADPDYEANFFEAIARTIPFLNQLLEEGDEDTQWKTVELVGNLANHGECQLKHLCGTTDPDYGAEFREAIASMWV
jgi:hypothetical protein